MRKNNDCIEYEYKTVTVSKKLHQDWEDVYSNLGWNVVERRHIKITPVSALISSFSTSSYDNMVQSNDMYEKVDLKLKRSHNIKNKNRISKIETTIKETLEEIEESVDKKYKKSIKYIYMTGIIGTILFVLSIISCMNSNTISFIILGILGSLSILGSIVINDDIKTKKFIEVEELIEENFDKIYFLSSVIK